MRLKSKLIFVTIVCAFISVVIGVPIDANTDNLTNTEVSVTSMATKSPTTDQKMVPVNDSQEQRRHVRHETDKTVVTTQTTITASEEPNTTDRIITDGQVADLQKNGSQEKHRHARHETDKTVVTTVTTITVPEEPNSTDKAITDKRMADLQKREDKTEENKELNTSASNTVSSIEGSNSENSLLSRIFQYLRSRLTDILFYISSLVSNDTTTEFNEAVLSTNRD